MGKYKTLGVGFDRDFRNDLNANFSDIDNDVKAVDSRVTNIVADVGSSNTEIVDAREGFTVLRDRLDDSDTKLGQKALQTDLDATNTQLAQTEQQVAKKTNWLNVKAYNAVGDGLTNDTVAFTNAMNDLSNFGTLYIPNGVYLLNDFTITNKSITIHCESEKVVFISSASSAIRFISDWTDIQNVSSIINTGSNAIITISNASKYAIGDIIKIVSEDTIEGYGGSQYVTDYGGVLRNAEYKTITEVNTSNNTITVSGLLRYTYTNSVRLGKQGKHTLKLLNGTLGFLSSTYGVWITGGINHELKISTVDEANHTSIELEGTYGLKCYANIGRKNNSHTGILDRNSSHFNISFDAKNCRHPFTTGHVRFSTQQHFYCYGVSEFGVIENSLVDGTCQSTYDSHEQAYEIVYRNSKGINNATLVGIQTRGKNITYENIHVQAFLGIQAVRGHRTDVGKVTYNNCIIDFKALSIYDYNAEFNNCTFICRPNNNNFFIGDAIVEFNNCKFYAMNTNSSYNMFRFERNNNTVRFNNCNVVYGLNASNSKLFLLFSGANNIVMNNLTIRSEVPASAFIGLRFQTDYFGVGSSLIVNNVYLDTINGLAYHNGSDDFNSWTAGLLKSNYSNFMFTLKKV